MKERKTIRNIALALGAFILWGNLISLLLPAEQYGAVIKTVDFTTVLYLAVILVAVLLKLRKKKQDAGADDGSGSAHKD